MISMQPRRPTATVDKRRGWAWLLLLIVVVGCNSSQWARLRRSPLNPLAQQLALDSPSGPRPTDRTLQLLRRNDLDASFEDAPQEVLSAVQQVAYSEPTADNVYSIAEVAYIAAKKMDEQGGADEILNLYATAACNAYLYLFDQSLDAGRNPYDPRFRRACELYNNSLESTLRHIQRLDRLKPGGDPHRCRGRPDLRLPHCVSGDVARRELW